MSPNRHTASRFLVLVALAMSAGCEPSALCDEDQTYANGVCYTLDAPAPTADADPRYAHFGDECMGNEQCAAPAPFCAVPPGATTGVCTQVGCVEDPAVCPTGWSCFDASEYQPGFSLCIQP